MTSLSLLLRLYWEFFKTGLFAVGGGLATLPFLSEMAARTGWFTHAQLADMVAVAESTPGPIGVNTATYVGFTTAGIPGAVIATLGLVTPSLIIILLIAAVLDAFSGNRFVTGVFRLLRPTSVALISIAGLEVAKVALLNPASASADAGAVSSVAGLTGASSAGAVSAAAGSLLSLINWRAVILFLVVFISAQYVPKIKKWHPIIFIGLSAVVGILVF